MTKKIYLQEHKNENQVKKGDVHGCPLKERNPAIDPEGGHPIEYL
jgi:hypothetical protein